MSSVKKSPVVGNTLTNPSKGGGKKSARPLNDSTGSTKSSQPKSISGKPVPAQPSPKIAPAASTAPPLDPLLFVLTTLVGQRVTVSLRNGTKWEGLFHSASPISDGAVAQGTLDVILSMAVQVASEQGPIDTLQVKPTSSMQFSASDLIAVSAKGISADPTGPRGVVGFQTDAEISQQVYGKERDLKSWADISDADLTKFGALDDDGSVSNWDQFEANRRLHGVTSTYREDLYTTKLDRGSEFYKQREAEAARLAAEIEGEVSDNVHLAEERGQKAQDDGLDEEDKYSSVIRQHAEQPKGVQSSRPFAAVAAGKSSTNQGGKYVVPARRSQTLVEQAAQPSELETPAEALAAPSSPTSASRRGSRGTKDPSIVLARQQEFTSTSPAASPKLKPAQSPTLSSKLASLQLDSSSPRVQERHLEDLAQFAQQGASQRREQEVAELKKFSTKMNDKVKKDGKGDDDAPSKLNANAREFKPGMSIMAMIAPAKGKPTPPSSGPQIVQVAAPTSPAGMPYSAGSYVSGLPASAAFSSSAIVSPAGPGSFFDRPVYADTRSSISQSYCNISRNRSKASRSRSPVFTGAESWADPALPPRRSTYRDPMPAIASDFGASASMTQAYGYYPASGFEFTYPGAALPQPVYTTSPYVAPYASYQYQSGYPQPVYPASPPQSRTNPSTGSPVYSGSNGYHQSGSQSKRGGYYPQSPPQNAYQQQGYPSNMVYYPQTPK